MSKKQKGTRDVNNVEHASEEFALQAMGNEAKEATLAVKAGFTKVLPVDKVQNIYDATILCNTAGILEGAITLAICRTFRKVKEEKLYKGHYESFTEWAQKAFKKPFTKSVAYNYATVGEYVSDDGSQSILPRTSGDYSYSQIQLMHEKLGSKERVIEVCEQSKITPFMSYNETRKVLRELTENDKKDDVSDEASVEEIESKPAPAKGDKPAPAKGDKPAPAKGDKPAPATTYKEKFAVVQYTRESADIVLTALEAYRAELSKAGEEKAAKRVEEEFDRLNECVKNLE